MINTSIKYIVYTHTGGGVRHHHFGTQNNIIDEADGHASPGDTINALGFASLPFGGNNLPFAFMSVHGAADGNHLYTSPGNQTVPVGTSDINILAVYAPVGGVGSGPSGPGIWVDAFNVDTGDFSDSDFIQILTPPTPPDHVDAAKSALANAEGDVATATAETLRAYAGIDGASFIEWKRIVAIETLVTTRDVSIAQNEVGEIWFAFYQTQSPSVAIPSLHDRLARALGSWSDDDYCGTGPHIGPRGPFRISLNPDLIKKLPAEQRTKLETLIKEYPEVANAAFKEMTKANAIIGDVGKLVRGKSR
jgi:hypothetical protein